MKNVTKVLALASCLAAMAMFTGKASAQGRGNFDPQQMMQRRLDALREQMDVKEDAEWSAISAKITKVMEAQRDVMANQFRGMGGMMRRNRGGDTTGNGDQPQRARRFGMAPSATAEALQKAIDDKAPAAEIKEKLAALRTETQAKEAALEKAREDLKGVVTSRQEAILVLGGVLK